MKHIELINDYLIDGEDYICNDNHGRLIRCRDCENYRKDNKGIAYCSIIDYGYGYKPDDYCSRARLREDG